MVTSISNDSVVIFDLDDTLFKEIEYLKSAFREISQMLENETGENVFDKMIKRYADGEEVFGFVVEQYGVQSKTKNQLIDIYRNHEPELELDGLIASKLKEIKKKCSAVGLITDGRSKTQRNKLESLGLDNYFDEVLISEEFGTPKPEPANFRYMQERLQGKRYVYIGDNIRKDFIAPNRFGWVTICVLDEGINIHPQNFSNIESSLHQPRHVINNFSEIHISCLDNKSKEGIT